MCWVTHGGIRWHRTLSGTLYIIKELPQSKGLFSVHAADILCTWIRNPHMIYSRAQVFSR